MLKKSLQLYIKNPLILVPLLINYGLIYAAVFLYAKNFGQKLSHIGNNLTYEMLIGRITVLILFITLIFILAFLVVPFTLCWSIFVIRDIIVDNFTDIIGSFKNATNCYFKMLGITALKVIIFIGLFTVMAIIFVPIMVASKYNSASSIIVAPAIIVFLTIAAVFSVLLMPVEYVMVYSGANIPDSFTKGFSIGRKCFWKLFAYLLVVSLAGIIVRHFLGVYPILYSLITLYISSSLNVYTLYLVHELSNDNSPKFPDDGVSTFEEESSVSISENIIESTQPPENKFRV